MQRRGTRFYSMKPNYEQLMLLTKLLEENRELAKGLMRTIEARHRARQKWMVIAKRLNAIGGAIKDATGWSKYWSDKKSYLKKVISHKRDGNEVQVSELESKMLSLVLPDWGPTMSNGPPTIIVSENYKPRTMPGTYSKSDEMMSADHIPVSWTISPDRPAQDNMSPPPQAAEYSEELLRIESGRIELEQSKVSLEHKRLELEKERMERESAAEQKRVMLMEKKVMLMEREVERRLQIEEHRLGMQREGVEIKRRQLELFNRIAEKLVDRFG